MFLLASCLGRHPDLGVVQTYPLLIGMHATSRTCDRLETYAGSRFDAGYVLIVLTVILEPCRPLHPNLGVIDAFPVSNGMHATTTACNHPGTYTESCFDVEYVLTESIVTLKLCQPSHPGFGVVDAFVALEASPTPSMPRNHLGTGSERRVDVLYVLKGDIIILAICS
jgi:hypothetical protein